jgi:hypothetical protein
MSPEDVVRPSASPEPLCGVLADRLQHPVALVREAQETLLDKRLERVDSGFGNLLRSVKRAATREDGQRAEHTLLCF